MTLLLLRRCVLLDWHVASLYALVAYLVVRGEIGKDGDKCVICITKDFAMITSAGGLVVK